MRSGFLSRRFRHLFLTALRKAFDAGKLKFFSSLERLREREAFLRYLRPHAKAEWVVCAGRRKSPPEAD